MTTTTLLRCGVLAGPIYVLVGAAQVMLRDGFDMRRHALSVLSNADAGWIQVTNFFVAGMLVLLGAWGVRRRLRRTQAGTWGPILLTVYGIGLVGAGVFVADPASGFPPGTDSAGTLSTSGLLHFVFGAMGFYALIAACFVFARRFAAARVRGWMLFSIATGTAFLVSFAAIASGATTASVMLAFYASVALTWAWHSALHVHLLRTADSR